VKAGGRTLAGVALGAAGVLYSRLGGRRKQEPAETLPPQPPVDAPERTASTQEVDRARSELSEELARRAAEQ
jgi:hypothetical protein